MKQKVVIKVNMNGQKSRSKAFKIAVSVSGVDSAAIGGPDKNQIEVTGEGVDAIVLTTLLRKNVGYAVLESVSSVGGKKEEKTSEPKAQTESQPVWSGAAPYAMPPHIYEVGDSSHYYPYHEPCGVCSIL